MGKSYVEKHITVKEEVYLKIKALAEKNHRTMRGQIDYMVSKEK